MSGAVARQRIEVRTSEEIKALISEAALHSGLDLTSFILNAVVPAAREVIEAKERVRLSREDMKTIGDLLEKPPQPTPALLSAAVSARNWNNKNVAATAERGPHRKAAQGKGVRLRKRGTE